MPRITAYLKENAEEVAKALKESGKIEFEVDGQKVELTKDDIVLRKPSSAREKRSRRRSLETL